MTVAKERPQTIIAQTREELCQNIKDYLIETLAHLIKYNGLISIGVSGRDFSIIVTEVRHLIAIQIRWLHAEIVL